MAEQIEAITGRRYPSRYRSMITAQAAHLPEMYAAKEQKGYQEETIALRKEELGLAERGQQAAQDRAEKASRISMVGTGATIGATYGGGYGAIVGGAIGLIASLF